MKNGRPPIYTPELAKTICARLAVGESLRSICRDEGMPSRPVVQDWIINNVNGFAVQYAHAKAIGIEELAEQTMEIADDGLNDTYRDDEGNVRTDQDVVARSRLRVDTRKWYLSKIAPKKYGDLVKMEVSGPDSGPIQITDKASAMADILAKAAERKAAEDKDLEGLV